MILTLKNYQDTKIVLDSKKIVSVTYTQANNWHGITYYTTENFESHHIWFKSLTDAQNALTQIQSAMKGQNMFKNILTDVKAFIEQHRNVIYWLALAFLVDHFFLNGKFREKLHGLVDKLLNKIEKHVDTTTVS